MRRSAGLWNRVVGALLRATDGQIRGDWARLCTVDHGCTASIGWMGKTASEAEVNNDLDRRREGFTQPALACTRVYLSYE